MKTWVFLFYACFALNAALGEKMQSQAEGEGHFAFVIPRGWVQLTLPKMQYPVVTPAPDKGNSACYIQVESALLRKSLVEFVKGNVEEYPNIVPGGKVLDQKPFVTSKGLHGIRVVANGKVGGEDLQAIWYFFEGKDKLGFIVMANCTVASFDKFAPIYDEAMKSFEILP